MKDAVAYIRRSLGGRYEAGEIERLTGMLMERVCGIPRYRLPLSGERALSRGEREAIGEMVERLRRMEPVQYIMGETTFYGMSLRVNPSVMIPRPETEELVAHIVGERGGEGALRVWDVGTGSGCIAIALARYLGGSEVMATDNSAEALRTAEGNGRLNGVSVDFRLGDMLLAEESEWAVDGTFDLIVSNPPYVLEREKGGMGANVLLYEPASALFVPDSDPLRYYRALVRLCGEKLRVGGWLYVEINERLGRETVEMLRGEGTWGGEVTLLQDLSGKERFIQVRK